jgi:hypothetical protein
VKTLNETYKSIHQNEAVALAFHNILFDQNNEKFIPGYREDCLDLLEKEIFAKIQNERCTQQDLHEMIIRKTDIPELGRNKNV